MADLKSSVLVLFTGFGLILPYPLMASPAKKEETVMTSNASLSGWTEFLAGLDAAGKRMAQRLPERLRADPVAVQQSYRLMLAATARLAIDAIVGDRAHPVFVRSEEHTSELQSLMRISYAVFCLKTKNNTQTE